MTTNLDIIKRAMKKIHVLAAGTVPTSVQAADGMVALQSMIVELIGQGSLGRLNDVLATSAYTACEFDRIQVSHGVTVTIPTVITPTMYSPGGYAPYDYGRSFFDPYPNPTSNRPPVDRACIVTVTDNGDGTFTEIDYVWCAYKGKWVQIQALAQTDDFPFASSLENGFAAMLAERLADDFDQPVGPETKLQAGRCRMALSMRHDSALAETPAHYF
jgi:hypothetical protein